MISLVQGQGKGREVKGTKWEIIANVINSCFLEQASVRDLQLCHCASILQIIQEDHKAKDTWRKVKGSPKKG